MRRLRVARMACSAVFALFGAIACGGDSDSDGGGGGSGGGGSGPAARTTEACSYPVSVGGRPEDSSSLPEGVDPALIVLLCGVESATECSVSNDFDVEWECPGAESPDFVFWWRDGIGREILASGLLGIESSNVGKVNGRGRAVELPDATDIALTVSHNDTGTEYELLARWDGAEVTVLGFDPL